MLKLNEALLLVAGISLVFGVALVYLTGSFSVWIFAKILYGVGVSVFIFEK